ncbi:MAG: acetyl-CoA C-acyltransferase family protein [Gammaproteobacteria bacterium]
MANTSDDVLVISGCRTAIGGYGGSLKDHSPSDLGAITLKEALTRSGLAPDAIQHVVYGNVIHTEPGDMYLSRYIAVNAGVPVETPAMTLNRLCGSGLQAIISAAQTIMLGDAEAAAAGGAECMSRAPYWLPNARWGQRMGDGRMIDAMVAALTDPFSKCHMGITAENVADQYKISREDQDNLAAESHQRAARATDEGYFKEQIVPVDIKQKKETVQFVTDEHIRRDVKPEDMTRLKPVFKEDGSVTAGNASGINDGAASLILVGGKYAEKNNLTPMGRLVGYAHAGVDPSVMGIGPLPAIRNVLKRTGLSVADMDVIELNEAFASQALAVVRELDLPMDKTNPNGSGISLGHPVGATGCIITIKALYELQRTGGRYALISMCIGGGQGIAAIFERLS